MLSKAVGNRPVLDVTRRELIEKLQIEKMHYEKHEDCNQLCSQIHSVFKMVQHDFALPLNVGADLRSSLPRSEDVHTVQHAPPMHYSEIPPFIDACWKYRVRAGAGKGTHPDVALLCLCIFLTGVRTQELRLATWEEINWKDMTWDVPPEHRKYGNLLGNIRPIPITPTVEKILREMKRRYPKATKHDVIFPVSRPRKNGEKFFADDTVRKFIVNSIRWHKPLTPHSARNAFRSWADNTKQDRRAIERQIDHALPEDSEVHRNPKLKRAYEQDMLMELRWPMMMAFDAHCVPAEPLSATVTHISEHRMSA